MKKLWPKQNKGAEKGKLGVAKIGRLRNFTTNFFLEYIFLNIYIYIYIYYLFFYQHCCYNVSILSSSFAAPYAYYSGVVKFFWFVKFRRGCEAKFLRPFPLNSEPPLLQKVDTNCKNKHRKKLKK